MTKATTLACVLTVWATAIAGADTGAVAEEQHLQVTLRNDAGADQDLVESAKRAVTEIYGRAGVTLEWVNHYPRFTVVLLGPNAAGKMHQSPRAMGFAPGTDASRGTLAYILMRRVDEVWVQYRTNRSTLLGAAIAHEIGHLLLPYNSHSADGLMRADWDGSDFVKAKDGRLLFNPQQTATIRTSLMSTN
jgi:hypothetical protein